MFGYYLELAWQSLGRNRALTVLMVVAIAFGVGASMTTLTVLHVLSADPIPGKSGRLFYVQLDPRKADRVQQDPEPLDQLSRFDAEALLRDGRGRRQAMMSGGDGTVDPQRAGLKPFLIDTRWTSADFFGMFEVPFASGGGWSADDDARHARVAVIARELAEKLFDSVDVVGKTVRLDGTELRIVGVVDRWRMTPRFYDLTTDRFGQIEQVFLPMQTALELEMGRSGNMNCWAQAKKPMAVDAACEWIQYWVELEDAAAVEAYRAYLNGYSEHQRSAGRFERPPNVRLRDVRAWLAFKEVVPKDVRLQTWIALGFLLVCLINTVGLLLTKFLRRSMEIGVRRALGASKRTIFMQLLVETGMVGLVGGALGLLLAWLGLWAVRHQPAQYAALAQLDLPMLFATFALAIVASLLSGVLPAWRGCQVTPAIQLKSH